jgi:hypothetical protein
MNARAIAVPDSRILEFCGLIMAGIESWTKAGRLLCEMKRDNPNVFNLIRVERPMLTLEVLETFERIGRKEIYPYLVADSSPGARRLMALPYRTQSKLYCEGVLVVLRRRGGFFPQLKKISALSTSEVGRVFDGDRIRSESEQVSILRRRAPLLAPATNGNGNEAAEPVELKANLSAEPVSELVRLLTLANDVMIECRSLLAMIKRDSRKDSHITNALIEIGSLRYAVNEGEL